ncbi:zf-CCHC_4 domain-containing protein, partial [Cephalotus follicularis]
LPLEFYDENILFAIGNLVGKPLQLDKNTILATKTKYACMCVEVDLSKLLVGKVDIGCLTQLIEYEGIHLICFKCGRVGHKLRSCTVSGLMTSKNQANDMQLDKGDTATQGCHEKTSTVYGAWMVPTRRNMRVVKEIKDGRKFRSDMGKANSSNNCFNILDGNPEIEGLMIPNHMKEITSLILAMILGKL